MTTSPIITLHTDTIELVLDPRRGAEILSVRELVSNSEVMWSTPWRERAEQIVSGSPVIGLNSQDRFLAGYRGGWQTLCPNAGPERTVHGAGVGFHGEVAVSAWTVSSATSTTASLHLDLLTVPFRVVRTVTVSGSSVRQQDTIHNLSEERIDFDYSQHPAFGADLLADPCVIETTATRYTTDPETTGTLPAGQVSTWPHGTTVEGAPLDLAQVPGPPVRQLVFGWLEGFATGGYTIRNTRTNLQVSLEWDATQLPYAWVWEELNFSTGFPWHRRARVLAIEPASCHTSGSARRTTLALAGGEHITIPLTLTVGTKE
ncbi:MAG: hypothetical protein B5766_01845 [Candidatus Lumbricidophila eiseniae]|uniref:Aldose epimerase n=1 Tax=Candidatus Lumbricidiphila eiseniae TaxID=1969409 RepID=A0A2A6FUX6_9MICO|nr:MAG: hypothetical protein B5766_01845 [Candidatus Lumbricidophila eiseniae]